MLELIRENLRTGIQTTGYPKEPDVAPAGFRGKPQLFADKCTYCGECARACPSGAVRLTEGGKALALSYCSCIFCGRCEEACACGAIRLTQEYELASKTKDDLLAVIRRRP